MKNWWELQTIYSKVNYISEMYLHSDVCFTRFMGSLWWLISVTWSQNVEGYLEFKSVLYK